MFSMFRRIPHERPPSPCPSASAPNNLVPQDLVAIGVADGWVKAGWRMGPPLGQRHEACGSLDEVDAPWHLPMSSDETGELTSSGSAKQSSLVERGRVASKTLSVASTRLVGIDLDETRQRWTKVGVMVDGKPSGTKQRNLHWDSVAQQHDFTVSIDVGSPGEHEISVRTYDSWTKTWSDWSEGLRVDAVRKEADKAKKKRGVRKPINPNLPADHYQEKLQELLLKKKTEGKIINCEGFRAGLDADAVSKDFVRNRLLNKCRIILKPGPDLPSILDLPNPAETPGTARSSLTGECSNIHAPSAHLP